MLVLWLDPYHLGDPLFVTQLARDLAHRGRGAVLVHGSGEGGERALEALGVVVRREGGVWATDTDEQRAAVERATRELGRRVVHELNEAGVAAIRLAGPDRGLVRRDGPTLTVGPSGWLATLVDQGVVAVVSSLVGGGPGPLAEADAFAVAEALAGALPDGDLVGLAGAERGGEGAAGAEAEGGVRWVRAAEVRGEP